MSKLKRWQLWFDPGNSQLANKDNILRACLDDNNYTHANKSHI